MNAISIAAMVEHDLAGIVGQTNVTQLPDSDSFNINGVAPVIAVSPGSPEEVAAVLSLANQFGLVVAPAGGLTKQQIGGVPERIDILLSTTRMNQIEQYDPGDLTVSVAAGMPFAAMQAQLLEHHQWVPCDAANLETATVGGLMATGAAGPLKSTFGHMRDFCIGVQFVTAEGKVAKGGGRVVKNVAGYDLMKLMTGSYGSLAVITRANFKVFPRPRQTRAFICSFHSLEEALEFRARIFKSPLTPMCMEILSPRAPEYLSDAGPVQDPDHYVPQRPVSLPALEWQVALRAAGSDNVLARYARELGPALTRTLDGAEEEKFWKHISHFEQSVLARHRNAMVIYTHLAIQSVGPALQALERAAPDYNLIPAAVGRAATGNLVLAFIPLSVDPPSAMQYANCVSAFRGMLPPGSSAEVAQCPTEAKLHFDVWGTTPTNVEMMRAVKRAIDPKNILNRGRFIV
ncbi:MAG TPA: FAD-binding oxidoreductase [Candidatus Angelobacter sp.]|nr:FAD-binding oxidoreductase [Candidatus Angelobacter sp.]